MSTHEISRKFSAYSWKVDNVRIHWKKQTKSIFKKWNDDDHQNYRSVNMQSNFPIVSSTPFSNKLDITWKTSSRNLWWVFVKILASQKITDKYRGMESKPKQTAEGNSSTQDCCSSRFNSLTAAFKLCNYAYDNIISIMAMIAHYSDLGQTSRKSLKDTSRLYNFKKLILHFLF